MADEKTLPQKLTVEEWQRLTLTGAKEILRFDEDGALIALCGRCVEIRGRELKLKTLSLDGGVVCVTGEIEGVFYEQPRRQSALGRWLGG